MLALNKSLLNPNNVSQNEKHSASGTPLTHVKCALYSCVGYDNNNTVPPRSAHNVRFVVFNYLFAKRNVIETNKPAHENRRKNEQARAVHYECAFDGGSQTQTNALSHNISSICDGKQ